MHVFKESQQALKDWDLRYEENDAISIYHKIKQKSWNASVISGIFQAHNVVNFGLEEESEELLSFIRIFISIRHTWNKTGGSLLINKLVKGNYNTIK